MSSTDPPQNDDVVPMDEQSSESEPAVTEDYEMNTSEANTDTTDAVQLATVTGSPLDLGAVQVALASWWDAALPSPRRDPSVRQLLDRLRVAPEEESVTSGGDVPA